ncbi:hypothetical protein HYV87_04750 [Candidatus Woesearchaeota archaeon]|nr:hypothetical protein [Candidatus Woesearchaeota archaeon]
MMRVLYGAPEPNKDLIVELSEEHQVNFQDKWLDFRFELIRCKGSALRKYDLVFYDTRLCREPLSPSERASFFNREMRIFLEGLPIPVSVIVDKGLKGILYFPSTGNVEYFQE